MGKINVAIIDDHDLFREGLKLVLSQIEEFQVIFDSSNGFEFLNYIKENMPDIVLMDINMPVIDGIETTKKAIEINADIKIISLSLYSDKIHYSQMINAGAKGFIEKKATKHELKQAIIEVYSGGNYISRQIMQKMAISSLLQTNYNELTSRETDVLVQVCQGLTSQEIADKLFLSVKTVEVHRTNIFRKVQVRNSAELIVWAVKNKLFIIN